MSIPRLELQAAVISARLVKSVQENYTLPFRRCVIWGDSKTVQSWIQSDQRQFVAYRISEILNETNLEEWRWVPTRLNVVDEAKKWGKEYVEYGPKKQALFHPVTRRVLPPARGSFMDRGNVIHEMTADGFSIFPA